VVGDKIFVVTDSIIDRKVPVKVANVN